MNTKNTIRKTQQGGYEAIENALGYGYIGTFQSEQEARAALDNCDRQAFLDSLLGLANHIERRG